MGFFVLLFLFWIPLALYTAKVAQTKGCSTGPWLIGGFLFGPVALLAAVGWPDLVLPVTSDCLPRSKAWRVKTSLVVNLPLRLTPLTFIRDWERIRINQRAFWASWMTLWTQTARADITATPQR